MKKPSKNSTRRRFKTVEKIKILKQHLVEGRPLSDVCDEHEIQPSRFYDWQTQLFQNATMIFDGPRGPKPTDSGNKLKKLEAKVREKDEVIAELMAEYLKAKKKTGENT